MTTHGSALAGALDKLSGRWLAVLWRMAPLMIAYAALSSLEGVAITRIDQWLPVDTMEAATRYAVYVSALALWGKLCLTGAAVLRLASLTGALSAKGGGGRFLRLWFATTLLLALGVLAVELWQHGLQFGGEVTTGETARALMLAGIYLQATAYYIAARFLLGAFDIATGESRSWVAAWSATTTWDSLRLFLGLIVLKLAIEQVLATLLSYIPFVAPFWFIPDELAPYRYFVGQGTRIAAECLGLSLYAGFFVAAYERRRIG